VTLSPWPPSSAGMTRELGVKGIAGRRDRCADGGMRRWVWTVFWLGCGGGGNPPAIDGASGSDGAADAADPMVACPTGGPPGPVTVKTGGLAKVVFHDAAGAVLSVVETDANNTATGDVPPCGAVTLVSRPADIPRSTLFTVTRVQPGDTISLVFPPSPAPGVTRQLTIEFPTLQNATSYRFSPGRRIDAFSACSTSFATTSPAVVDIDERCTASDGTTALTATALDVDNQPLGYASLANVATATASITQWRDDATFTNVGFANSPDPTWESRIGIRMFAGELALDAAGGLFASLPGKLSPAVVGDHAMLFASLEHPQGHESGIDMLQRMVPAPLAGSLTLDGGEFAPHVDSCARDDTNPARPVITWTTSRSTAGEHAIVTTADYEDDQWFLVAAPDQPGAVRYPDLPANLRPASPPQTGPQALAVMVADTSLYGGYDDVRRQPFGLWFPHPFVPRTAITSFTFRFSALGDFDEPEL
jgi:hypothetical protein